MGELQQSQPLESMSASSPSQAIVDVVENMRAKIHALFCKIGYTELSGMTTEDYVTLTIIEQYLNLKVTHPNNSLANLKAIVYCSVFVYIIQ